MSKKNFCFVLKLGEWKELTIGKHWGLLEIDLSVRGSGIDSSPMECEINKQRIFLSKDIAKILL